MKRVVSKPLVVTVRVVMRDDLWERLLDRAIEERVEPRVLAGAVLERAVRRWKPRDMSRRVA